GTTVLLPGPGGASSTAQLSARSAAASAGSVSTIGSGGRVGALTVYWLLADFPWKIGSEPISGATRMAGQTWMYVLAGLLVMTGVAGLVLPALPGVPLVFGGLLLAAWADDFTRVSWITLVVLGLLTVMSFVI